MEDNDKELTYSESETGKLKTTYLEQVKDVLHNIPLNDTDTSGGLLTPSFFHRFDVPHEKRQELATLTDELVIELRKVPKDP